ncbi:hypothetical protein KV102_04625 [Mumia sp. zg.B53]|uniref:hypothetical protein n=1 Tax=Mumia sp. zg.B53 TaxID=2855449 RepID=UPI001C6F0E80|nr:hypothetical protein [Mumia sp. zg.B53]MBW9214119.1 hypothetical protein [Mumia sp. zg.B53]
MDLRTASGLPARRDPTRWRQPVHDYPSIEALISDPRPPAGILAVRAADTVIDLLYDPRGAATTIVSFHAAITTTGVTLPYFTGGSLHGDSPVNRILVADPALYRHEALTLAWYAGTDTLDLQHELPRLLDHLHRAAGGSRRLYFGGSGGGFAALFYGAPHDDVLSVAVNPQTVIANYTRAHVERYARTCWGASDEGRVADALEMFASDLRPVYREARNQALYIQNTGDNHRVKHMEPFMEAEVDRRRLWTIERSWGPGHVAVPADELRRIVSTIVARPGDWASVMRDVEARQARWWRKAADPAGLGIASGARWEP